MHHGWSSEALTRIKDVTSVFQFRFKENYNIAKKDAAMCVTCFQLGLLLI